MPSHASLEVHTFAYFCMQVNYLKVAEGLAPTDASVAGHKLHRSLAPASAHAPQKPSGSRQLGARLRSLVGSCACSPGRPSARNLSTGHASASEALRKQTARTAVLLPTPRVLISTHLCARLRSLNAAELSPRRLPYQAVVANNLAAALEADGQLGGARAIFDRALQAAPHLPPA